MIKTIKKIDLQGNEIWQEVVVCNRCKKVLEHTDFVYETKWTGWHTVKLEPGVAYGFGQGSNPVKHICENCQEDVEAFLNGEYKEKHPELTTFDERVDALVKEFRYERTHALKQLRSSFMCSMESAKAIDIVLSERIPE